MNMELVRTIGHFAVSLALILSAVKLADVFVWFKNEREERVLEREFAAAGIDADDEDDDAGDDDYSASR